MSEIENRTTGVERDHLGLKKLALEISHEHRRVTNALSSAVEHAITAGGLLNEAKKHLRHGEWLPWLEKNFSGSVSTANNYMRCANNRTAVRKLLEERNELSVTAALEELSTPRTRPALEAVGEEKSEEKANSQRPANLERFHAEELEEVRERSKNLQAGDIVPEDHWITEVRTMPTPGGYDPAEDERDRKIRRLEERIERQAANYLVHIGDLYQRFGAKPPQTLSEVFDLGEAEGEEAKEIDDNWREYGLRQAAKERKEEAERIHLQFKSLYLSGILDENLDQYAFRPLELASHVMDEEVSPYSQEFDARGFEQIGAWLLQVAKEIREYRSSGLRALPPPDEERR